MALESQLLELPFQTGIDQKVDSRWLQVGSQTTVTNGRFSKAGAIAKRFGLTKLGSFIIGTGGDSLGQISAPIDFQGSLNVIASDATDASSDSHNIFGYAPTPGSVQAGNWMNFDKVGECRAWRDLLVEWPLAMNSFDIAYASGYVIVAWAALEQSSATIYTAYVNIIDAASGTVVASRSILPTAGGCTAVRLVAGGTSVVLVSKEGGGTAAMHATVIDLSALSFGSPTSIVSDYDTTVANTQLWDAAWVTGSTSNFVVFYPRRSGGVSQSKLIFCDTTPSVLGNKVYPVVGGHVAPGHGFAVVATSGENVWTAAAYDSGANTDIYACARTADSTLALVLAETQVYTAITGTASIRMAVGRRNATTAIVAFSPASPPTRWREITTAGAVSNTGAILYQHILAGKPFMYDGIGYLPVACTSTLVGFSDIPATVQTSSQGNYSLIDMSLGVATSAHCGRPVACLAPRIANTTAAAYNANWVVTNTYPVSSTQWVGIGTVAGSTSTRFGLNQFTYDFAGHRWQSVEIGESAYVSGGVLSQFDGQRFTEVGFLHPPPGALGLSGSVAGGALTATGYYTYYVVYQWFDAKGQVQRSAASVGSLLLTGAQDTITLTIQHASNTLKQDDASSFNPNIGIQIYRNTNPGAIPGATFYQLLSDASVLKSLPTTQQQTYADGALDTTIASNAYGFYPAQGGALEGYTPGSVMFLVKHNDRLWALLDDRVTWNYSTEIVVGEQVRFNDNFIVVMPEGPVTCGASMDGVFYSFTRNAIWAIAGDGPNEEGTGSNLQTPQRIPCEVGCVESRSLVSTSQGIYFQALNGIYLLTRGREVVYVGQAVEDLIATYPIVKSATLVPRHTEIRLACATTESSTVGVELVYNYTFKAWSVFDRSVGSTATFASKATAVIDDQYYWLTTSNIYEENTDATASGAFKDDGTWVPLTVESAWVHAAGIQGWGRFRYVNALIDRKETHDLTVSVAQDFNATYAQSHTFTALEMSRWTTPLEAPEVQIAQQKASALRIKLSDSAPSGMTSTTGQGATFVGLQIEYGAYPRRARLPTAQGA